jgi:hypothetical protein
VQQTFHAQMMTIATDTLHLAILGKHEKKKKKEGGKKTLSLPTLDCKAS